MSTIVTFSSAHVLTSEFFMARRPVLDRLQHPVAHDLLFFQPGADAGMATILSDVAAHGVNRLIGEMPAYLQVDAEALASDLVQDFPSPQVVFAIPESVPADAALRTRIADLAQDGRVFALDFAGDTQRAQQLLPSVTVVRIDIAAAAPAQLPHLCRLFQASGKKLLAKGIDTAAQFDLCAELGFDYFEGGRFAGGQLKRGEQLTPQQQAIADLLALIESDAADGDIEYRIKTNVSLGLNLLRLADTPATGAHRIDSLRQALAVVGRDQLRRWLQIMQREEAGDANRSMPLLMQASTRGRLMELLAHKLVPGNRGIADTAFMVGIMSLMENMFDAPMNELLRNIPLADEVRDALLSHQGYFGKLLTLAEHAERVDSEGEQLQQQAGALRLSHDDLYLLQLAAFEWSDQASRGLR